METIQFIEPVNSAKGNFYFIQLENGIKVSVATKVITKLAESRGVNMTVKSWREAFVGLTLLSEESGLEYFEKGAKWGDEEGQTYNSAGWRCTRYPQIVGKTNFERLLMTSRANGTANLPIAEDTIG